MKVLGVRGRGLGVRYRVAKQREKGERGGVGCRVSGVRCRAGKDDCEFRNAGLRKSERGERSEMQASCQSRGAGSLPIHIT